MKARKRILGLLLSAFIFVIVHDFIITHIDPNTQTELYMHKIENVALCDASIVHELIHMTLMTTNETPSSMDYMLNIKTLPYLDIDDILSALPQHRLYRPPIA